MCRGIGHEFTIENAQCFSFYASFYFTDTFSNNLSVGFSINESKHVADYEPKHIPCSNNQFSVQFSLGFAINESKHVADYEPKHIPCSDHKLSFQLSFQPSNI
jgi:hypothetical protein